MSYIRVVWVCQFSEAESLVRVELEDCCWTIVSTEVSILLSLVEALEWVAEQTVTACGTAKAGTGLW